MKLNKSLYFNTNAISQIWHITSLYLNMSFNFDLF